MRPLWNAQELIPASCSPCSLPALSLPRAGGVWACCWQLFISSAPLPMPSPSACLLGYDASKYPQCNLRSGKPGTRFWHLMSPGPPQPPTLCRSVNFFNSQQVRGGPLETVLPSASCLQGNYGFPQTGILPESYRGAITFPKTRRMPCSSASQVEGK